MFVGWDGQWDYDVNGDALATTLDFGDNFVVNVKDGNSKDVDFWLICCTKPLHQVRRAFMDKWGTSFVARDSVVANLYYQRWGHNESFYMLLKNSHVVYMHVHLVWAMQFLMLAKDHRVGGNDRAYEFTMDTLLRIKLVITFLEDD